MHRSRLAAINLESEIGCEASACRKNVMAAVMIVVVVVVMVCGTR
jgi:hypothetical protein